MNCPAANLNQNPNPNHFYTCFDDHHHQSSEFELSDYLVLDDDDHHRGFDDQDSYSYHQSMVSSDHKITATRSVDDGSSSGATSLSTMKIKNGMKKKKKMEVGQRFAFRTKSELEVMDDGFRWRKYGKKSVKNSPNLRNYYKCSSEGCPVKKRVERDREDSSYVITTYEGTHSHESPSASSSSSSSSSHHQQQIHQITFTSNLQQSSSSS